MGGHISVTIFIPLSNLGVTLQGTSVAISMDFCYLYQHLGSCLLWLQIVERALYHIKAPRNGDSKLKGRAHAPSSTTSLPWNLQPVFLHLCGPLFCHPVT